jgi:integrase
MNKSHRLTGQVLSRRDMLRIVKGRCKGACASTRRRCLEIGVKKLHDEARPVSPYCPFPKAATARACPARHSFQAGLPDSICNHTFRGTGITVFLQNGGSLEAAQDMANHTDPRTMTGAKTSQL